MSKHRGPFVDDGLVLVTLAIPTPEMAMLKETLSLSRERIKDPARFIESKAFDGCISLASSTVTTDHWKHVGEFASKLGVRSPI